MVATGLVRMLLIASGAIDLPYSPCEPPRDRTPALFTSVSPVDEYITAGLNKGLKDESLYL